MTSRTQFTHFERLKYQNGSQGEQPQGKLTGGFSVSKLKGRQSASGESSLDKLATKTSNSGSSTLRSSQQPSLSLSRNSGNNTSDNGQFSLSSRLSATPSTASSLKAAKQPTSLRTSKISPLSVACRHNGVEGVSGADIVEHLLDRDFGKAARDAVESEAGQKVAEVVKDALEHIGNELLKEEN